MFARTNTTTRHDDFAAVMKRVIARFNTARTTESPVRPTEISLEEQLSVLARIKAKREAQLHAEMNPPRRTHRDLMTTYTA